MARETSGRIKKYGVCLNSGCTQYKQIQEIMHGDMECPECHKKLSPCAPPAKKSNKKLPIIIGGAVVAIAIVGGCIVAFSGGKENPESLPVAADTSAVQQEQKTDTVTMVKTDTVKQVDTVTVEKVVEKKVPVATKKIAATPKASAAATSGHGNLRLSYGKYTGDIKGGYPEGMGRLTYSTGRVINKHDSKSRRADAGDYVIGEFLHGYFIQGKHYDASGNLIETLMIGTPATSDYESK